MRPLHKSAVLIALVAALFLSLLPAISEDVPAGEAIDSFTELKQGDQSRDVAILQLRLSQLGFLNGKIDGKFGPVTLSAVKAFQRANDLEVSSVASAQMQQALYAQGALDASGAPVEASPADLSDLSVEDQLRDCAYVGNRSSHKFHRRRCGAVKLMRASNKVPLYSKEEAQEQGFVGCRLCHAGR